MRADKSQNVSAAQFRTVHLLILVIISRCSWHTNSSTRGECLVFGKTDSAKTVALVQKTSWMQVLQSAATRIHHKIPWNLKRGRIEGRIITTTYYTVCDVFRLRSIVITRRYTVLSERELVQKATKFSDQYSGWVKFHAEISSGNSRDQNRDLFSKNCTWDMRTSNATGRQIGSD